MATKKVKTKNHRPFQHKSHQMRKIKAVKEKFLYFHPSRIRKLEVAGSEREENGEEKEEHLPATKVVFSHFVGGKIGQF